MARVRSHYADPGRTSSPALPLTRGVRAVAPLALARAAGIPTLCLSAARALLQAMKGGPMNSPARRCILTTLAVLLALPVMLAGAEAAQAASGACSVKQARRDLVTAKVRVRRAKAQLREAERVLAETRRATRAYGAATGRWVRLSRRVGWPWREMPTLARIIAAESGGNPSAYNASSGCAGLLQLAPCHYRGRFDPLRPRANLACGLKLWRGSGWQPWTTY